MHPEDLQIKSYQIKRMRADRVLILAKPMQKGKPTFKIAVAKSKKHAHKLMVVWLKAVASMQPATP